MNVVTLIAVVVATLLIGATVRFTDRRHQRYNALVLPAISLCAGLLGWVILQFLGLGYDPDLFWLSWLLPILASAVITVVAAWWLGRHRESGDAEALRKVSDD